jgi:DNA-binding YbaB/EbfC family protein
MSSIGKLMKQAAKIQRQMEAVQSGLSDKTVEVLSGGGLLRVTAKGDGTLAQLKLDAKLVNPENPAAVSADDLALLEKMLTDGVNEAITKAKEMHSEEMGKVTKGFSIPGLT